MKSTHGARRAASSKSVRTRFAPRPTKTSTKSEPEHARNGMWAADAIALASSVLPVPGGPASSTPRGQRAPTRAYRSGSRRHVTTSMTWSLICGSPATSANVTAGTSRSSEAEGSSRLSKPRSADMRHSR